MVNNKHCECGAHRPSFGLPGTSSRDARWCAGCPTKPSDAVNVKNRRCECGLSEPSFGLPDEGRRDARWCARCPGKLPGAVNVKRYGRDAPQKPQILSGSKRHFTEDHLLGAPDANGSSLCLSRALSGPDHVPADLNSTNGHCTAHDGSEGISVQNVTSVDGFGLTSLAQQALGLMPAASMAPIPGTIEVPSPMDPDLSAGMMASPMMLVSSGSLRAGRRCECGIHRPSFGPPGASSRDARWCAKCPMRPADAVNVQNRRCECGMSEPSFGLPGSTRKQAQWCAKCPGKAHQAVNVKRYGSNSSAGTAMAMAAALDTLHCVPPGAHHQEVGQSSAADGGALTAGGMLMAHLQQQPLPPIDALGAPTFEPLSFDQPPHQQMPTPGTSTIMSPAATSTSSNTKRCECGAHRPSFGLPGHSSKDARWCAGCPTKPSDAVNVKNRRCECGLSEPSFGMPDEERRNARWCSRCPGKLPGAVNVKKMQSQHKEQAVHQLPPPVEQIPQALWERKGVKEET